MKKLKCTYNNGYGCYMCLHKQTPALIQGGKQFTWLLQNTGNMTLLFTVDTPVDKQYHKWNCLKNKEWRENGVMHLPPGSSAQMINHERRTTEILMASTFHLFSRHKSLHVKVRCGINTSGSLHSKGRRMSHYYTLLLSESNYTWVASHGHSILLGWTGYAVLQPQHKITQL